MSKRRLTLRAASSTGGLSTSGVFANQLLKHSRKTRRKPFGSDTLGRNASALAY